MQSRDLAVVQSSASRTITESCLMPSLNKGRHAPRAGPKHLCLRARFA